MSLQRRTETLEQERLSAIDLAGRMVRDKLDLLEVLEEVFDVLQEDCEPWSDSLRMWMAYKLHIIADKNDWKDYLRETYLEKFQG